MSSEGLRVTWKILFLAHVLWVKLYNSRNSELAAASLSSTYSLVTAVSVNHQVAIWTGANSDCRQGPLHPAGQLAYPEL